MTHQFIFTHESSSVKTIIEVDQDVHIQTLIEAFEVYLNACQYSMDNKHIELVEEEPNKPFMGCTYTNKI